METNANANRLSYLDNVKVFLTVLVIFHHAGQAYGQGGGWAYMPSNPAETLPWIWHFFSTNASFFMGLYFLISGYFVPRSYDRKDFRPEETRQARYSSGRDGRTSDCIFRQIGDWTYVVRGKLVGILPLLCADPLFRSADGQ